MQYPSQPPLATHVPACSLAQLGPGERGRVAGVAVASGDACWLRAVGVFEGQWLSVLRRGLFGGPLHVRTACGGEFAIDRTLARAIGIERGPGA